MICIRIDLFWNKEIIRVKFFLIKLSFFKCGIMKCLWFEFGWVKWEKSNFLFFCVISLLFFYFNFKFVYLVSFFLVCFYFLF